MVEYRYQVTISAQPDQIWKVMTDFETYGEWNDFYRKIVTKGGDGDRIRMHVTLGSLRVISIEKIRNLEDNKSLGWGLDNFLMHTGVDRSLTIVDEDRTQVSSVFKATGALSRLAMPLFGNQIQAGMENFLDCLKRRVENS